MRRIGIAVRVLHGNRACGAGAALLGVQVAQGDVGMFEANPYDIKENRPGG